MTEASIAKLLLVEDEPELRQFLKDVFTENRFAAHVAETGAQALEEIKTFKPDIIVLDHNLPDMKGSEVLLKLRRELENRVPVIFLTAVKGEDSVINAFDLGADDYIEKPFSTNILKLF